MQFYTSKVDFYLENTPIENLFINEYMLHAKGDYVKVYLFARMYADHSTQLTNDTIARDLGLSIGEVLNAWDYWETQGVIIKHHKASNNQTDFDLEFVSLRQLMFKGAPIDASADTASLQSLKAFMSNGAVIKMLSDVEKIAGRPLGATEYNDIKMWVEDFGMEAAVIIKAYDYCSKVKKNVKHSYVSAVIKNWRENQLADIVSLENYLNDNDKRHSMYKRIFRALGFQNRMPTEEEKRIIDIWIDELFFDMDTILEACKKTSGISNPSINYINAILKSWHKDGTTSSEKASSKSGIKKIALSEIMKSYEELRKNNLSILEQRKEEIYNKLPRIIEIDKDIRDVNPRILKMVLSGKKDSASFKSMQTELSELEKEKRSLLEKNGFSSTYLDAIYECSFCKDTGFLDSGEKCVCFVEKTRQ